MSISVFVESTSLLSVSNLPETVFTLSCKPGDVFHGRVVLDMLDALVPEFQLRYKLVVQLADVDIINLILPLKEGASVFQDSVELGHGVSSP